MANEAGTSGGWRGLNGAQRRIARLFAGGFLTILTVIMVANAVSMKNDFDSAGVPVTTAHVWTWEVSSVLAWLTLTPAVWRFVAWLQRARLAGWIRAAIVAAGAVPASAWHIGVMIGLRVLVYALAGERYVFMKGVRDPVLYEFRKDIATYLQFAAIALVAQWLIGRAASPAPIAVAAPRTLAIADGAVTHRVPLDEIASVAAAGNYVEIAWRGRALLQRGTLAAVEAELGSGFARIHRGRLVRLGAIRRIETDRSGDFTVTLDSGAILRGSRRYRAGIEAPVGV